MKPVTLIDSHPLYKLTLGILLLVALACTVDPEPVENGESGNNGSQSDFDRPVGTYDIISDAQLESLLEADIVIYEGDTPPDIEGVYDRAGGTVTFSDDSSLVGRTMCYSIWTVEATGDDHVYVTSSESYNNCSGGSEGTAAYLSGSDGCFTLFKSVDAERSGCEYRSAGIISGCLETDGIRDFMRASLALDRPGPECDALIDAGNIPAEGDRLVSDYGFVQRQ
jgi:hypothetical protein